MPYTKRETQSPSHIEFLVALLLGPRSVQAPLNELGEEEVAKEELVLRDSPTGDYEGEGPFDLGFEHEGFVGLDSGGGGGGGRGMEGGGGVAADVEEGGGGGEFELV